MAEINIKNITKCYIGTKADKICANI